MRQRGTRSTQLSSGVQQAGAVSLHRSRQPPSAPLDDSLVDAASVSVSLVTIADAASVLVSLDTLAAPSAWLLPLAAAPSVSSVAGARSDFESPPQAPSVVHATSV